ncbi:MAG TPA: hypothetical protein VH370_19255 [Humisphaera sp.]|nr:hypothetical protein [Humisphaera sp.]
MSMAVLCASNLRQVGLGCIMYANDNNGHWPDDLSHMMIAEDVAPEIFVCPAGSDTPAAGPTTQAIAANFALPGHNSYVYLGKGLVEPLAPNLVVAYERPQPKGHPGTNVLFADGHVERLDASVATTFLRTAQASSTAFAWTPAK